MRALPVLIITAGTLIATPAADARDVRITWPKKVIRAGEFAHFGIASDQRAKVSLVRLSTSGKPLRPVATRSLKRGTFSVLVPRLGTFQLRVVAAGRRYTRSFEVTDAACPGQPGATLTITLRATSARAGTGLPYELRNTGTSCVFAGDGYHLDRRLQDGGWTPLPPQVFTLRGYSLTPGITLRKWAAIPAGAAPGRYRLTDSAMAQGGDLTATAEFDVIE